MDEDGDADNDQLLNDDGIDDDGSDADDDVFFLLVVMWFIQGILRECALSSLRTGHSHEDIDQIFGRLSKFMVGHGHGSQTPEDFQRLVDQFLKEAAFPFEPVGNRCCIKLDQTRDWCAGFIMLSQVRFVCCLFFRFNATENCVLCFSLSYPCRVWAFLRLHFLAFQIVAEECISKPSHTSAPSRHRWARSSPRVQDAAQMQRRSAILKDGKGVLYIFWFLNPREKSNCSRIT